MTGMALAHCILGKSLGVVCHCFPPPLDVLTFAARCLYVRKDARGPSSERWKCGREICPVILPKFRLPRKFRALLRAANLRHGTDGFTSPPKEGVLRNFFTLKIRWLRPGLNPRTWVLNASTLTLDHRRPTNIPKIQIKTYEKSKKKWLNVQKICIQHCMCKYISLFNLFICTVFLTNVYYLKVYILLYVVTEI